MQIRMKTSVLITIAFCLISSGCNQEKAKLPDFDKLAFQNWQAGNYYRRQKAYAIAEEHLESARDDFVFAAVNQGQRHEEPLYFTNLAHGVSRDLAQVYLEAGKVKSALAVCVEMVNDLADMKEDLKEEDFYWSDRDTFKLTGDVLARNGNLAGAKYFYEIYFRLIDKPSLFGDERPYFDMLIQRKSDQPEKVAWFSKCLLDYAKFLESKGDKEEASRVRARACFMKEKKLYISASDFAVGKSPSPYVRPEYQYIPKIKSEKNSP